MRTSNKILTGAFIAVLLIITGIYLALYAKYRNNDFITLQHLHEERYDSYPLQGIQFVSLSGLQNVTVVSSDTARLEIAKKGDRKLTHEFANAVLTVKGDTTIINSSGMKEKIMSWRDVIIYLPQNQHIKSNDCTITIKGSIDSAKAPSVSGEMENTTLRIGPGERLNDIPVGYFNKLSFTTYSHGYFETVASAVVRELSIDLQSSGFEDDGASFGNIIINADSSSTIKLSGKNIVKTKFALK